MTAAKKHAAETVGGDLAAQLFSVRKRKRSLEKQERELTEEIRELLGDRESLVFQEFIVLLSTHEREQIDKTKLKKLLGAKGLREVTAITEYETIQVKER